MPSAYTLLSLAAEVLTPPATPRVGSLRSSWEPCRAAPNHRSPRCHRTWVPQRSAAPLWAEPRPVPMPNPDARLRCVSCRPRCHTTPSDPAVGPRHRPRSDPAVRNLIRLFLRDMCEYRVCHVTRSACLACLPGYVRAVGSHILVL